MTTPPSIGQWVWGEELNPYKIIAIGSKRSTGQTMLKVLCPQGSRVIPLESVKGVALTNPNLLIMPRLIREGDRVRLKGGTQHEFTVVELYSVRCDRDQDDEPFFESWVRIKTPDGKTATWKLSQLNVLP